MTCREDKRQKNWQENIPLCKVYKNIKLSIYDKEKIIKDILPLNYYRHGNFCITETGTVALYDFLPDYEYGLITTDKSLFLTDSIIDTYANTLLERLGKIKEIKVL